MGSRRVLGNDPFQRGAAGRTPPTSPAADEPTASPAAAAEASKRSPSKKDPEARAKKSAARAPKEPTPAPAATSVGVFVPEASAPAATPPEPPPPVPLAASVVAERPPPVAPPPPPAVSSAPPPRAEVATESLRAPLADRGRAATPAAAWIPPGLEAPTLTWTPLPGAVTQEPESPRRKLGRTAEGTDTPGATSLVEALREAPGLLAEAWSAIEAALRAIRAGLGTAGGEQLDVYGRDTRLSEAVAPLVDFLYSRWFRVEVEGASHVPPGGALLVANHAGALPLDGPMLHEALRRERPDLPEARWLAEDQVFYAPLLGTLFNRLGAVRASPDSATRLLAEGRPVLIFPEGIQGIGKPFRDRYRLQRFGRGGFVKLALRTRHPILPVAIMGAEETLPLLGKLPGGLLGVPYVPVTPLGPLPLPAKWRIRIGEPIEVPPGARETDLSVVESLVEATRNTIEHMLRSLLGARGGVFLG